MEPEGSDKGGIRDSVISGDVHHHHYANESGIVQEQPQQIIIDPNTGLPQNVMIIQQQSSSPQVVGILVIIYGAIGVIGSALGIFGGSLLASEIDDALFDEYAMQLMIFSGLSGILSVATIISGIWINNRQTKGIHLAWAAIGIGFVLSVAQQLLIPEELSDPSGMGQAIGIGFSVVCNAICGLIVAIPLMVSGSGMDNTKLLG